jgi:ABC-2 type transport system permease protein
MSRILLVALREYRQVTGTRGFWILLMVIPLAIAASVFATRFMGPPKAVAYVIVDPTGRLGPAVDGKIAQDHERDVTAARAAWVAQWTRHGRLQAGAPPFRPPEPRFVRIAPPPGAPVDAGSGRFGAALQPYLQGEVATPLGPRPLALAVWVPAAFPADGRSVAIWMNRPANRELDEIVRSELTRQTRLEALRREGVSDAAAQRIDALTPPVEVHQPAAAGGRARIVLQSVLPLALVYLLLVSAMTTGSMMLQGVIEERSNRLLESVLACIGPNDLMLGKLVGLGAVGLTIVGVWVGCAVGAGLAASGAVAVLIRQSLQSLNEPWMAPALIFYFVSGYLIISAVFLAIGSMSESMQDAQAYLMPVLMTIMMPIVLMIDAAVLNPDTPAARIMTWIPIYTPFAMLARLGGGVSPVELFGSGALLIAFLWLEMVLLGRIFRASILATGQRPPLSALVRMMVGRGEG